MPIRAIVRNAAGLGLFALFTAGLIAVTHQLTRADIERNAESWAARTLYDLVPPRLYDQPLAQQAFTHADIRGTDSYPDAGRPGYRAIRSGRVEAVVLPASTGAGYNGDIDLLIAVDRTGEILGVRVVAHRETPGLGDGIEADRSDWILQFDGRSLGMPAPERWRVSRDGGTFDQLTGATITSRAVVEAVRSALEFFRDHRQSLLAPPQTTPGTDTGEDRS